ncbi:uncharacterized protein LOC119793292 [Cyprinodon tularosa]|uniref:uncharacterized protein LOC119793292 n=1 Tax=Cyprinodon tularosa TaxID=77115 RepID=UPI0018E22D1C|nr:uncharacterized protein LOC119793292 [Cyprinodon tularosa]
MAGEQKSREKYLQDQQSFRTNAFLIIKEMVHWCNITEGGKILVDEILHSIFFLGEINTPRFPPEEIIPDQEILDQLKEKYNRPFDCYRTHLPRRSPFSCVLDMIVLQKKPENENQIKQTLMDLVNRLAAGFLVSSTICISKSNKSNNQYGVSMSTTGRNAGRIVIAASCLSSYWDKYVAGAVMTYYPQKKKKSYFDGTFELHGDATCTAYSIKDGSEMDPCKSCGNLFGLQTTCEKEWPYGNCAEAESLSNLFRNDAEVKRKSRPTSDTCTPENRERAKVDTRRELTNTLKTIKFNTWKGEFYRA